MELSLHLPLINSKIGVEVIGGFLIKRGEAAQENAVIVARTKGYPSFELAYKIVGQEAVHLGKLAPEIKRAFYFHLSGESWESEGQRFTRMTPPEIVDLAYGKTFTFRHRSEMLPVVFMEETA